jgi:aminoglycoside-2''-adenylyltransferase
VIRTKDPFAPVMEVAASLSDFAHPWWIAGGWAIDLFLGRVTRNHEDVDVGILRRDQGDLRAHLEDWIFEKVQEGRREPCQNGEWLSPPIHELHARLPSDPPRDIEFLLNEAEADDWVFRRDARIRRPLSKASFVTRSGIPCLDPAIVLLFKAKTPVAKDLADFDRTASHLGSGRRLWLRHALETCHPGHPWIAKL